jgi:phage/conjugal plasmid C-4 type zinc finger TraR family protein
MNEVESFQHSNIDESEMGQIHAIHLNDNAIAAVRRSMPTGESAVDCTECGEKIPESRRAAAKGCLRCIHCQTIHERKF